MLYLISQEISAPDAPLLIWLIDMSNRASPFCEFDIQGIPVSARQEFGAYASRAWVKIQIKYGSNTSPPDNAYAAEYLQHLIRMHESIEVGEPPSTLNDFDKTIEYCGAHEDLDTLWAAPEDYV
ncbi:hypothetical protein [Delftia acidovorans]|uniref:hypothetical protein n=1 Tax=Delftia acidovorans TaxID=80866 RepID=UPI0012D2BB41|nr:hypothetical protein [Delftia acidovorans]QQB51770.1 hypothetical protein I6H54_05710 [Delftia acidovorans]